MLHGVDLLADAVAVTMGPKVETNMFHDVCRKHYFVIKIFIRQPLEVEMILHNECADLVHNGGCSVRSGFLFLAARLTDQFGQIAFPVMLTIS